jgi:hypothetical protein
MKEKGNTDKVNDKGLSTIVNEEAMPQPMKTTGNAVFADTETPPKSASLKWSKVAQSTSLAEIINQRHNVNI